MTEWRRFVEQLRRGEHIASPRGGDMYDHHGIYVGEERVIHFRAQKRSEAPEGYVSPACETCRYKYLDGGVVKTFLACFHKGKSVCTIRYRKIIPEGRLNKCWKDFKHGKVIKGYRSKKNYIELFEENDEFLGHHEISQEEMSETFEVQSHVFLSELSSSKSPDEVIEMANNPKDFGRYHFLLNNCEDFAVFCKTGKARSLQVQNLADIWVNTFG